MLGTHFGKEYDIFHCFKCKKGLKIYFNNFHHVQIKIHTYFAETKNNLMYALNSHGSNHEITCYTLLYLRAARF